MILRYLHPLVLTIIVTAPTKAAECEYSLREDIYRCNLEHVSVTSENFQLNITGTHVDGYSDADVKRVLITDSSLNFLQKTILDKFHNLQEFMIEESQVQSILPDAFASCVELLTFSIEDPNLDAIPSKLFSNCYKLKELTLKIRLTALPSDIFYGLSQSLTNLDLSGNQIMTLTERPFEDLIRLKVLNLAQNALHVLDKDLFISNKELVELNLMGNKLTEVDVPNMLFNGLSNLEVLDLRINFIKELNTQWFQNLSKLHTLDLSRNFIEELPENSFVAQLSLKFLYLEQNSLESLTKAPFSKHLFQKIITVDRNQISSIQLGFFESFPNLEYFQAAGNECINGFMIGFEEPIDFENEQVKEMLADCYGLTEPMEPLGNNYILWICVILGSVAASFGLIFVVIYFVKRKSYTMNKGTV